MLELTCDRTSAYSKTSTVGIFRNGNFRFGFSSVLQFSRSPFKSVKLICLFHSFAHYFRRNAFINHVLFCCRNYRIIILLENVVFLINECMSQVGIIIYRTFVRKCISYVRHLYKNHNSPNAAFTMYNVHSALETRNSVQC